MSTGVFPGNNHRGADPDADRTEKRAKSPAGRALDVRYHTRSCRDWKIAYVHNVSRSRRRASRIFFVMNKAGGSMKERVEKSGRDVPVCDDRPIGDGLRHKDISVRALTVAVENGISLLT